MNAKLFAVLAARRAATQTRWEELLQERQGSDPIPRPFGLLHWIPDGTRRLFGYLEHAESRRDVTSIADYGCACGRNPYVTFYHAGEQALIEALAAAANELGDAAAAEANAARVYLAVQRLGMRDIDQYCRVCPRSAQCAPRERQRAALPGLAAV